MNKRIEELAKQCTIIGQPKWQAEGQYAVDSFDKEKFAELIVQECLELVAGFYYYDDRTCHYARPRIRQHFGIEQ